MAQLRPQDGLVMVDLLKKRSKFAKIVENVIKMASDGFSIEFKYVLNTC